MRSWCWILLLGCSKPEPQQAKGEASELAFRNMTIVQYDKESIVYRASAKSAAGDNNALTLTDVKVAHRGFPETGAVTVTAKQATVHPVTGGISVQGNVLIEDSHSRRIRTELLEYTAATPDTPARVQIPSKIRIDSPEITTDAGGLDGSPDTGVFHISGPVDGTYTPR